MEAQEENTSPCCAGVIRCNIEVCILFTFLIARCRGLAYFALVARLGRLLQEDWIV